jgi:hypothetical protein
MAHHLAELVDCVATVRVTKLSPSPSGWNGTWLLFGPPTAEVHGQSVGRMPGIHLQFRSLDLSGPGPLDGSAAEITADAAGRLVQEALSGGEELIGELSVRQFAAHTCISIG